jgi:hypothetical protein
MRRRTIDVARESPVPVDPYLDAIPKHVWVNDGLSNYTIVLSNTGWLLE